jgi:serine/threonine-protein kinase mTOR
MELVLYVILQIFLFLYPSRLAACLSLKEFAIHAPTTFHSKTSQSALDLGGSNEFLDHIFQAIRDPQPIVRTCAADALSQCLIILVERRHSSLTGLLCQVYFALLEGLNVDTSRKQPWHAVAAAEASQHGSLLVVSSMIACTGDFMIPRFEEVCRAVLSFTESPKALVRLEIVRLIPRLAGRCPRVFGRRYLDQSLAFLMECASTPMAPRVGVDIRPSAYTALGQMVLAMVDDETGQVIGGSNLPTIKIIDDPVNPEFGGRIVELKPQGIIYEKLEDIFALLKVGLLQTTANGDSSVLSPALNCGACLVTALGDLAKSYLPALIDEMFRAGLSNDLIKCLQSIAQFAPGQQAEIEDRMLQEIAVCLAGTRDPLASSSWGWKAAPRSFSVESQSDIAASNPDVVINMSDDPEVIRSLVLSLQTLESFDGTIRKEKDVGKAAPLLSFVQGVVCRYLAHPSGEVRRAAALTCCTLLLPFDAAQEIRVGGYTGIVIEDVLEILVRVAVSDPAGFVRLCVVQALDSRYDAFLCQRHHLQDLFLLLQDEDFSTRAAGLRLLSRLAGINPANVLPGLRRFLNSLSEWLVWKCQTLVVSLLL